MCNLDQQLDALRVKLNAKLDDLPISMRHRQKSLIGRIMRLARQNKPYDRVLAQFDEQQKHGGQWVERRQELVPAVSYPEELPFSASVEDIHAALNASPVVIVAGETGSGKSTQLPKLCLQAGRGVKGVIAHTQPRRLAARTIASRVADELKVSAPVVASKVRFDDNTSDKTLVKLTTDGMLLAEIANDPLLLAYDTVIVDEAHERSLNIDLLLGHLKRLLSKRRDFKVVITSATIDTQRFAEFFATNGEPAPIVEVSGRSYPVEIRYRPMPEVEEVDGRRVAPDPMAHLVGAVEECLSEPMDEYELGDVLVFQPTERDIRETTKVLEQRFGAHHGRGGKVEIMPLYARLSYKEQQRAFARPKAGVRRVVVATNVAESSVTVPGIRYVVDTGRARMSRYASRSSVQRLPIEAVSKASCNQRSGRCGRLGPGVAIRLYSSEDFSRRDDFTTPEVQRCNLAGAALQCAALNLGDVADFPWMDPPRHAALVDAKSTLFELGAMDSSGVLTKCGRQLARLPVDPRVGRMLIAAHDEDCLAEVLVIASFLEVNDPRERPAEKTAQADQAHAKLRVEGNDFLGVIKLWRQWLAWRSSHGASALRREISAHYLSHLRMREWQDLHNQLARQVGDILGLKPRQLREKSDEPALVRALLSGLLSCVAIKEEVPDKRDPRRRSVHYKTVGNLEMRIWPGSSVKDKPAWVMAAERIETSDRFLRMVCAVDPRTVEKLGSHLLKRSHSDPQWDEEGGRATVQEAVSLYGLPLSRGRRVSMASVNPAEAREWMIRHALVQMNCPKIATQPFVRHNQKLLDSIEKRQMQQRRIDLLADEDVRCSLFDRVVPQDVTDVARLLSWIRKNGKQAAKCLELSREQLLSGDAPEYDPLLYPDHMNIGGSRCVLSYQRDRTFVWVSRDFLAHVDLRQLRWGVRGRLSDLIENLLRTLPKSLRRPFTPLPQTAKQLASRLEFGQGDLEVQLCKAMLAMAGSSMLDVRPDDFDWDKVEPVLRIRVQVIDAKGNVLDQDDDPSALRQRMGVASGPVFVASQKESAWMHTWQCGMLEPCRNLPGKAGITAYPALVAESRDGRRGVVVRELQDALQAKMLHAKGLLQLVAEDSSGRWMRESNRWVKQSEGWQSLLLQAKGLGFKDPLDQACALCAIRMSFLSNTDAQLWSIRSSELFEKCIEAGHGQLYSCVSQVMTTVVDVFARWFDLQRAMERTRLPAEDPLMQDLNSQLVHLTGAEGEGGFLLEVPFVQWRHYPRYLSAMHMRLQKATQGQKARDRERMGQISKLWVQYLLRTRKHREEGVIDPEREKMRWMLEEMRVQLFAQELGCAQKVSVAKLHKQFEKLRP